MELFYDEAPLEYKGWAIHWSDHRVAWVAQRGREQCAADTWEVLKRLLDEQGPA